MPGSVVDQDLEGKKMKNGQKVKKNPNPSLIFKFSVKMLFKCLIITDICLFSDLGWLNMNP